MKQAYQAQSVKDDARGRWERVLPDLAPALKEAVERRGKHVPCPVHGGRDGFRVFPDVDQTGGGVCNTCGFFADGLSLLMWVNDWDFGRTIREVAEHVGGQPVSSTAGNGRGRKWYVRRCYPPRTPQSHLAGIPPADAPASRAGSSVPGAARSVGNGTRNPALSSRAGLLRRSAPRGAPSSHPRPGHRAGGDAVTLHRTYLTVDGHKAPVDAPKKLMRHPSARQLTGGAIRLVAPGQSPGGDRRHRNGAWPSSRPPVCPPGRPEMPIFWKPSFRRPECVRSWSSPTRTDRLDSIRPDTDRKRRGDW
jgi:putative DNA primase/helicase